MKTWMDNLNSKDAYTRVTVSFSLTFVPLRSVFALSTWNYVITALLNLLNTLFCKFYILRGEKVWEILLRIFTSPSHNFDGKFFPISSILPLEIMKENTGKQKEMMDYLIVDFIHQWILSVHFLYVKLTSLLEQEFDLHYLYITCWGEQTSFMSCAMFFNVSNPSAITSKPSSCMKSNWSYMEENKIQPIHIYFRFFPRVITAINLYTHHLCKNSSEIKIKFGWGV